MSQRGLVSSFIFLVLSMSLLPNVSYAAVDYDIVYVKQPRLGDEQHVKWPEVFHPAKIEPNSDLMLLHPDGSEEVLVDATNGAVTDPFVSFDGKWVYYSYFHDVSQANLNTQRADLSRSGSDIFRINLASRVVEQLTFQEFTPNTGAGNWDENNPVSPASGFNRLGYGILNMSPAPIAGNKIVFTSSRNGFRPTKPYTYPTLQLFVMDENGSNVTAIAPMTLGSALHPTPLKDGRIMFSSYESQGLRDQRNWGIWSIWPDGRQWRPVVSSFKSASAFHFMTQLGNGDLVVEDYYNLNNFGFGALYRLPATVPAGTPAFFSAFLDDNPSIEYASESGDPRFFKMPFTPRGIYSITPMTTAADQAAPQGADGRVGKFTHPSAAPNNDLLVAWSGGPVNRLTRPVNLPAPDAGIYIVTNGDRVLAPSDLVLIKNDPNYNEVWPRAVVPYNAIYGVEQPVELPWLPNDGTLHQQLPQGTPYGLVGSSSFYNRESFPGFASTSDFDGLDAFNTSQNGQSSNWSTQGADAGKYTNNEIWAVRVLAMEPNSDRGYGPNASSNGGIHFFNHANERLRILGEIPLRNVDFNGDPVIDQDGNPDTSFLAKIPADTPFTFQTIDRNGLALNTSQTWHQVRPGEIRNDCGGCHAHSSQPLDFNTTAAASADYQIWDLTKATPLISKDGQGEATVNVQSSGVTNVEFFSDIRPILQRSCIQCHTNTDANPPASLVLDDYEITNGLPGDYNRLCNDASAKWGIPPLVTVSGKPSWRQTNASRYVRKFQSRRSLLMWKIFGQRLDGWTNEDHPSASVPGDASTLPDGAKINSSDIDYIGSMMPPPDSFVPGLSDDEKMTFARWIDLGCPINKGNGTDNEHFGWFMDEVRPTLEVSMPKAGANEGGIQTIRIGLADAYTGIDFNSFSVTADFVVEGRQPGEELAGLFAMENDGVYTLSLSHPLTDGLKGLLRTSAKDRQGNITRVDRVFTVSGESNNQVPTAVIFAGNTTIKVNESLLLDGQQSGDADGDAISYQWALISQPNGSNASLSEDSANTTSFRAATTGNYQIKLTVSDGSLTDVAFVSLIVNPEPVPDPGTGSKPKINLSDYEVLSYGNSQDREGNFAVQNDGSEILLDGNVWKKITRPYLITENTVIEFDFSSDQQGDIHGIGFDNDNAISSNRTFQLYGAQSWGIKAYAGYEGDGVPVHYKIRVGDYYTGQFEHLFFVNDHDISTPNGSSNFANIMIYEDSGIEPFVGPEVLLAPSDVLSFGGGQDTGGVFEVQNEGHTLSLAGNLWKKVVLSYQITANTMLSLDFTSDIQGEIHGIGFDTDDDISSDKLFQLWGDQKWGLQNYRQYSGDGHSQRFVIPVGEFYTGKMKYLIFVNDHDISHPTAQSNFSNILLYEKQ